MSVRLLSVRVSVASMVQRFHGCEPTYIHDVCRARCCDASGRPSGTLVTIHPSEQAAIRARGGVVTDGLLESPGRVCPFKTDMCLCQLHDTPDKPFGCIASPFTLNKNDVLVVRNRYRMLPCYSTTAERSWGKDPAEEWPCAYVAFRASLDRIFGATAAAYISGEVSVSVMADETCGSFEAMMPETSYRILKDNDAHKKAVLNG